MKLNKDLYYILNLTWGLPLTLIGAVIALVLLLLGYKPKKWAGCIYFEIGEDWGGLEFGLFFLCCKDAGERLKNHEYGHSIQNMMWGPFTIIVIFIPSAIRYWIRELLIACGKKDLPPYDSIWFEGQATKWGTETKPQWD